MKPVPGEVKENGHEGGPKDEKRSSLGARPPDGAKYQPQSTPNRARHAPLRSERDSFFEEKHRRYASGGDCGTRLQSAAVSSLHLRDRLARAPPLCFSPSSTPKLPPSK